MEEQIDYWAELTGESIVEMEGKQGKIMSHTQSAFDVSFEDGSKMMYPLDLLRKKGKIIKLYRLPSQRKLHCD